MANKYYAVKIGKVPGIYNTWEECKSNVENYPNAKYKSFKSQEEAENFINDNINEISKKNEITINEKIYSFVDGSFNPSTNVYGCGGFLIVNDNKYVIIGSDDDEEMATMRNVAGEILGATLAVKKAIELKLPEITIYYDYLGIEKWATNEWKATKQGTIEYKNFMREANTKINIKFVKVKGHSGIEGNEEADKLAKQAVGVI